MNNVVQNQSRLKRGDTGTYRLYLHDEAPRIGSGWRRVNVKVGNHRVRLVCSNTGRTARIARPVFDQILAASL